MERITKIVLHPLTQRIIGVLCFIPTISTFLLDSYNYFYPSFDILDLSYSLYFWRYNDLVAFFLAFVLPFVFETLQEFVKYRGRMKYEPIPLPKEPTFTEKDVTVIVPILNSLLNVDQSTALRRRINTILEAPVAHIFLVASSFDAAALRRLAHSLDDRRILATVMSSSTARTDRHLIAAGLPSVQTPITIIASEYVSWPPGIVPWLLAPFKDEKTRAVGTLEHVMKPAGGTKTNRYWNAKIAKYTEELNKELIFAMGMGDKRQIWKAVGGSTCAVKTKFLRSDGFEDIVWRKHLFDLDSSRDLGNGRCIWWKTYIQYSPECFVQTTPPDNTEEGCERWLLKRPPLQSLSK